MSECPRCGLVLSDEVFDPDDALITLAEAAEVTGYSHKTLKMYLMGTRNPETYARFNYSFPLPHDYLDRKPVWLLSEVSEWHRERTAKR